MDELDPARTEAVRRALASARHDGPMPPEVAARLDAVLADLTAESAAPAAALATAALAAPAPRMVTTTPATSRSNATYASTAARVVPLHRRRWSAVLAAAAAVVAVGLASTEYLSRPPAVTTADSAAEAAAEGADSAAVPDAHKAEDSLPLDDLSALTSGPSNLTPGPSDGFELDQRPNGLGERFDRSGEKLPAALLDPAVDLRLGAAGVTVTGPLLADADNTLRAESYTGDRIPNLGSAAPKLGCLPTTWADGALYYRATWRGRPAYVAVLTTEDGARMLVRECTRPDTYRVLTLE